MSTKVPDMFSLAGKTALITGAARGIGQAMAIALAEAGADIILVLRDHSQTSTKIAIEALGRKCYVHIADLSVSAAVSSVIPTLTSSASSPSYPPFSILINNAGIQRRHPAELFPDDAYAEVIQVNLSATFVICRDVGKYWLDNNIKGRIVNTASLATFQGGVNIAAYAASKGAVGQLTKALSNEWAGRGIRVNAIAPGYIATDMNTDTRTNPDTALFDSINVRIPAGSWGTPEDFKGPVVFLASDASSYVSGEILLVDGGWMAR